MSGRLIFTRQTKQDVDNHYVVGAGVGSPSRFARQALRRRASNSQRVDSKGKKVWGPCQGFCAQYPASGAQQRAARAVRAFQQLIEENDVNVQMPTSITVSADPISGNVGGFSRTTLSGFPVVTHDGQDVPFAVRYAMGPLQDPGLVVVHSSESYPAPGQAGIEIIGPTAPPTGPYTTNSSSCASVGGCGLTYGNTEITVAGAAFPDDGGGAPSFKATTVLTFYDATF